VAIGLNNKRLWQAKYQIVRSLQHYQPSIKITLKRSRANIKSSEACSTIGLALSAAILKMFQAVIIHKLQMSRLSPPAGKIVMSMPI